MTASGAESSAGGLENSAAFPGVFEQAPFSIQVFSPDGRTVRVNRAWEELWGVKLEQIADYNVLADPQLEAKGVAPYIRRAFAGESVRIPPIEYNPNETIPDRTRHSDPRRWVAAVAYAVKDASGKIREVVLIYEDITAQKLAEEKLRLSQERFSKAFQASPDAMIISRAADGLIREANDQFLELVGLTREQVLGRRTVDLGIYADATARAVALELLEKLGRLRDLEGLVKRSNGELRNVVVSTEVIEFEGDKWLLTIGRDITERKRREAALRESEQRFARLRDASIIGIITGEGESITGANDAFLQIVGYDRADLEQGLLSWPQMTPPEHREKDERALAQLNERGWADHYEKEYIRKDGTRVPILLGAALVTKTPFTWICFVVDLTERYRAQQALKESETRFRTLAEQAPVPIALARKGVTLFANDAYRSCFGIPSHEQVVGRPLLDEIAPEHHELIKEYIRRRYAGEQVPAAYEFTGLRRDGTRFPVEVRGAQISLPDGPATIAFITDLTERRLAETRMRESEARLERAVAERTLELRETNEQLEAFVYSIAHDLRGPLRSMSGYSQLLVDDYAAKLEDSAQHMLRRIQASAEFMDRLLLDLLAYGRAARAPVELGPVSVEAAWKAAVFQCTPQIESTQATVESAPNLPSVVAHEATLGQCLANLLSNALKFTAPGRQPRVRLYTSDEGSQVRVWIEDNGLGVPMEHHERIFRVFERAHGSSYAGSGIGLSIVRKGAERMGGTVGLASEPGKGSKFWIQLRKAANWP
jgi:PAS domain S-box-containing protein